MRPRQPAQPIGLCLPAGLTPLGQARIPNEPGFEFRRARLRSADGPVVGYGRQVSPYRYRLSSNSTMADIGLSHRSLS